jgi:diacylglycerol kinase (CTP)
MKSVTLKSRTDLHIQRKLWHFAGVMLIAYLYQRFSHSTAIQIMALTSALFIVFDLLRKQVVSINQIIVSLMSPIMRENERHSFAGTTYLLLGVFIVMLVFPKQVVLLTLLLLGTADPIASYVGIKYGTDRIFSKKTLQGSVAAFLVCTIISILYYYFTNAMTERILIVGLLTGVVGTLSELIPIKKIDDNLTFPILSSIGIWGIYYLFGGF